MAEQSAEQITNNLIACGLATSDFRILEREGSPLIVLDIPLERKVEHAPLLAEYFYVGIGYDGTKPTAVVVRVEGDEPSAETSIVMRWKKGLHSYQIRTKDKCERCHDTFKLADIILFNYNDTEIVVCFPCCKAVVAALMQLPLEERTPRLQMLRERWTESEAAE